MMTYLVKIRTKLPSLILIGCLIALIALQGHNILMYPADRGFDARDHIEYINYLTIHHRIPYPNEGWELYQPPAYYLMASGLSDIKAVQFLGFWFWGGLVVISGIFAYNRFKSVEMSLLAAVFTGSLPVLIYQTPNISNELMNTCLISLVLGLTLEIVYKPKNMGIWIGWVVISALSWWVKATALLPSVISVVGLWWWLPRYRKRVIVGGILLCLLGGWYYGRNLIYFGTPLVTSVDFAEWKNTQVIVPRTLSWWLNPVPWLKFDLFTAHWQSFLAGTYFSFFYDGHNNLIPVQTSPLAGKVLVISSLGWVGGAIFGLGAGIKRVDKAAIFLGIYSMCLMIAYGMYNLKLPYASTVKGIFIGSLALPLIYGLMTFMKDKPRRWVYPVVIIWVYLIVKNFWILPHWY